MPLPLPLPLPLSSSSGVSNSNGTIEPTTSPKPEPLECTDVLTEISRLLQCPLDRETIALAAGLLERGANPEALAALVVELNCEAQRHQV